MDEAVIDLKAHYEKFEAEFHRFFQELIIFSRQHIETL